MASSVGVSIWRTQGNHADLQSDYVWEYSPPSSRLDPLYRNNLWSLILGVLGIRELQELSTGKAILAVAIAVMIPLILIILFAVFFNLSNMFFYPVPGYAD
jgi:hypothetical protein